jgi:hypothetical protein
MSVRKITKTIYRCTCELPDCPSHKPNGEVDSWDSKSNVIPPRCNFCHRYTWNGVDRRRADTKPTGARTKQA